jgi:phospholipid/cholesterol/gamma-HCH transport system permease protein
MTRFPPIPESPSRWAREWAEWVRGWWQIIHVGAQILVLVVSPSSYRQSQRGVISKYMYMAVAPLLPGFTLISAVVSLVIIRIVIATTLAYGLSQYALELLIRTLVLELLPLSVALYVAVRYTMPQGKSVRDMRLRGELGELWRSGKDPARDELLPRVGAGVFAVILLAVVSSLVMLVLAYLSVYGFKTWGLAGYSRSVGQVFSPVVTLIFCMKTFFFSLAVSVIPIVYMPQTEEGHFKVVNAEIMVLARVFAVILLVEVLSLVGNYY